MAKRILVPLHDAADADPVLPLVAGVSGDDYRDPAAFAAGFRMAMVVCAALLGAGAFLAAITIKNAPSRAKGEPAPPSRRHCSIEGPPLHEVRTRAS